MSLRTEDILALEARQLASNFNFDTRKPKNPEDLNKAKILYKEIFYDKSFYRVKTKNYQFAFDAKVFSKMSSCTKCAKHVHVQLKDFADRVLNE